MSFEETRQALKASLPVAGHNGHGGVTVVERVGVGEPGEFLTRFQVEDRQIVITVPEATNLSDQPSPVPR